MIKLLSFSFAAATSGLAVAAGMSYKGNVMIYVLFTLLANTLLFNGFRKRSIYFDTFIGVFFWLGFWLKFSLRIVFASGQFREAVGAFDGSALAFDHALIISSCGIAGLLVAGLIREWFFVYPEEPIACARLGLFLFYQSFREYLIGLFILVVVLVAVSNAWLGIYQRGMIAQTILPLGLNGVFKWLLQFGLASISALIVRFEMELNRNLTLLTFSPAILESLFSNVSLLSRGMILNSSALAYGYLRMISAMRHRIAPASIAFGAIAFAVFFTLSVYAVNHLRAISYWGESKGAPVAVAQAMATPLFIDRWVGIEGVLAVSSSKKLGWDLWREAWKEEYNERQLSLYDRTFIDSPYANPDADMSRNHYVSLPGLVAFLYYPGSLVFLFAVMLACALMASSLEIATYRFCGRNWILCSLFAQVIAFRYASFGYVPGQSYLLFGTLVLNGLIIFMADDLLRRYYLSPRRVT